MAGPHSRSAPSVTAARLSIGEVASRTNVAASALRFYEDKGLIPAPHRVGGQRRYGEDVLARIALIQVAQDAGFSLGEISVLLEGIAGNKRDSRVLAKMAKEKLGEIETSLKRLRLLQRLMQAATSCSCPTLDDCAAAARRAGLLAGPIKKARQHQRST